jgi:glycosyltransferase involved in cell wall biosynthesis
MTISIIIVCFNSGKTIGRALESIRKQVVLPDEVIIIDGGSIDNTLQVVQSFDDLTDIVISESDTGIYNAMNKGLKLASGNIVGYLNSDDEFSSHDVIFKIKEAFNRNIGSKIFVSGVDYLKTNGSLSRSWRLESVQPFELGWHPPHPGFYARRSLLTRLGGFNEEFRIAADFDLMLRSFEVTEINEIVVDHGKVVNMYLGGVSNASVRNVLKGNSEIRRSFANNGKQVTIIYTIKRIAKKFLDRWQ